MKKALLLAAFVFSMNAYAQNLQPLSTRHHLKSTSLENVQNKLKEAGVNTTSGIPGLHLEKDINQPSRELLDLIQLIDSTYSWVWDTLSADWTLDSKIVDFFYNAAGLPTSFTALSWTGSDWEYTAQANFTYDADNNQTSAAISIWNGIAWQVFFQVTSTYDGNKNLLTQVEQFSNGISLMNSGRATYTYDANNNLLTEVYESWNGVAWEYADQYLYTYDANGNDITVVYQTWDGASWLNNTRDNNTFDANNNNTNILIQDWNGTTWEDAVNVILTYDANNNLLSETDQLWNITEWENYAQYTYTYNADNNITSELAKGWDGSNWINFSLRTYTYDGTNLINERYALWNGIAFIISESSINTYDTDNFLESYSYREFDESGTVVITGDSSFNFFHTASGIKDISDEDGIMEVYPNPSNGKFTISSETTLKSVEVFNLLGERIYLKAELNSQPTHEINLAGYGKGIYIVSTSDGVNNYSRKIIVQ